MARSDHLASLFSQPSLAAQRHYEICREYFRDEVPARDLAAKHGMHLGSVQSIVRDFAADPDLGRFFVKNRPGRKTSPKRDAIEERACELRKQGKTLEQVRRQLAAEGHAVSSSYLFGVLRDRGLTETRQRRGETPLPGERAKDGSEVPRIADVKSLALESGREFVTESAGLFLFVRQLLELDLAAAVDKAGLPGSERVPPLQSILALLAAKLLGKRRVSHIADLSNDEGAGLFAGLNVLPKTTFSTDYSYRTDHEMNQQLMSGVLDKVEWEAPPALFNLDFHAIPFRGEDSELEKHWIPKQGRATTSVMAFVAQEWERRVLCYATANVLRQDADSMVVAFADYWKERTGKHPQCLLFDSRSTTYDGLHELNKRGIGFVTIRRRGSSMLKRVRSAPASSWTKCQITQAKGGRRAAKYLDETVTLDGYEGSVRQIVMDGLGRDNPTFLLTNDLPEKRTARETLQLYATRNRVENSLGEQITFFHLDCLSSDVRLNVDFDITLTVIADLLYRRFAEGLAGFRHASPLKLFRKFVDTHGSVRIADDEVVVRLVKHAHNPVLREAGAETPTAPVPWLGGKKVRIEIP